MKIHLNAPYKIAELRHKRYEGHYHIPAERSLVIPQRELGDEVACDVLWEEGDGESHVLNNIVFVNQNLIPVNDLTDTVLIELWSKYSAEHGQVG